MLELSKLARVKLDQQLLGLSTIFERLSKARVKDCFKFEETIYFVVATGEMGKAVGKGGSTIKRISQELGKKIRIIEYRDNVASFVRNVIYPLKVEEIIEEDGNLLIKDSNKKIRSLLIGRDGKNLALLDRAVKRFFNVSEVKVV